MDPRNLVMLLIFCLMFLHDFSDITPVHAPIHLLPTRKIMITKRVSGSGEGEEKLKGLGLKEELRIVPSGPDPLHHHVNPPRQPRTDSHLP